MGGPAPLLIPTMCVTFSLVRCARATTECAGVSLYRRNWGTDENGRDTVVVTESGRDTFVRRENSLGPSGV